MSRRIDNTRSGRSDTTELVMLYIPFESVPLLRLFRNPINGKTYQKLAFDKNSRMGLAITEEGDYWDAQGHFMVEMIPISPQIKKNSEG